MLKLKSKKSAVLILLTAITLLAAAASPALARETPPPTLPDETNQTSADTPNLIMTQDGNVTTPEKTKRRTIPIPNTRQLHSSGPKLNKKPR